MDGEHIFAANLEMMLKNGRGPEKAVAEALKYTKFAITELDHVEREVWETRVMKPSAAMVERRRSSNVGDTFSPPVHDDPAATRVGNVGKSGEMSARQREDEEHSRIIKAGRAAEDVRKEMRPFGLPDPKILMDQLAAKGQAILDAKKAATEEANAWRRPRTGPVPESNWYFREIRRRDGGEWALVWTLHWITKGITADGENATGRWYGPLPGPVEG